MRKTDKYINKGRNRKTKPKLTVVKALSNQKYEKILMLLLWGHQNNKKIKKLHLKYALVKNHAGIDLDNTRLKNTLESFFTKNNVNMLTNFIKPHEKFKSESNLGNYLNNLNEKLGLIQSNPDKKGYNYYTITEKGVGAIVKKICHNIIDELPNDKTLLRAFVKLTNVSHNDTFEGFKDTF